MTSFAYSGAARPDHAGLDASPGPTVLTNLMQDFNSAAIAGTAVQMLPEELSLGFAASFSLDEISELIVPRRTLARRVAQNEALSQDETDRAIRVGTISLTAERVFGNRDKAQAWLRRPNSALTGQRPLDLLRSEAGTLAIHELLGQIDHGMFV